MHTRKSFWSGILALLLLLTMLPVTGVQESRVLADEDLPSIQNVNLSASGILTWDPVQSVKRYEVKLVLKNTSYTRKVNTASVPAKVDVREICYSMGYLSQDIKVTIVGVTYSPYRTLLTQTTSIVYTYKAKGAQLKSPTNLRWKGNVLTWDKPNQDAQYRLYLYFKPEGETEYYLDTSFQDYQETSFDLSKYLVYGTHSYQIRIQAYKYGYPNSKKADAYRNDYKYDKKLKVTYNEFSKVTFDVPELGFGRVLIKKDGNTVVNSTTDRGVNYIQDICDIVRLPEGSYEFSVQIYRNINNRIYMMAEPWEQTFDYVPYQHDLHILGYTSYDMEQIDKDFAGQVGYNPKERTLKFFNLDVASTPIGERMEKYCIDNYGPLFEIDGDLTVQGNAKMDARCTFIKSSGTIRVKNGSNINITSQYEDAIVGNKLIVEGGTYNIKSNVKNGIHTTSSIALCAGVRSFTSEGASGFGAMTSDKGKIILARQLRISVPTGGNLGKDAHHVYQADGTVADKAKVVRNTPTPTPTPTKKPTNTPTPTRKVTPTPTKKVTPTKAPTKKATPTPTKKVTPTPTKKPTPTKAPTKGTTFEDFAERINVVALDRRSAPDGIAYRVKQVVEEGKTGPTIAPPPPKIIFG